MKISTIYDFNGMHPRASVLLLSIIHDVCKSKQTHMNIYLHTLSWCCSIGVPYHSAQHCDYISCDHQHKRVQDKSVTEVNRTKGSGPKSIPCRTPEYKTNMEDFKP